MKQYIGFVIASLKIELLAQFFVIGNMGVSFIDCSCFFYRLYALSFQLVSLCFFVLGYFVIIYWKKIKQIPFDRKANINLGLLRVLIFLMLIGPTLFDSHWQLISFEHLQSEHFVQVIGEALKVFGIELLLELFFYIYHMRHLDSGQSGSGK